jgi:hypothetical protein
MVEQLNSAELSRDYTDVDMYRGCSNEADSIVMSTYTPDIYRK